MEARDFCFWLRGYFEITGNTHVNKEGCKVIKEHLDKVFAPKLLCDVKDVNYFNMELNGSC